MAGAKCNEGAADTKQCLALVFPCKGLPVALTVPIIIVLPRALGSV